MRLTFGCLATIATLSCIYAASVPDILPRETSPTLQKRETNALPTVAEENVPEQLLNPEPEVEADPLLEAELEATAESSPSVEAKADGESAAEPEPVAEPEPEPSSEPEPEPESEPQLKVEANTKTTPTRQAPPSSVTADTSVNSAQDVCITKGCVKAASSVIEQMNPAANPCDDFFEFSCGSFVKNNHIPEEKSGLNSFSVISDELTAKLRTIVQDDVKPEDSIPTKMVKDLYSSCMNTTARQTAGLKPLQDILARMGGWPVVVGSTWDPTTFDWIQATYTNREEGFSVDYFFDLSVSTDIKNTTKRIIWLDQTSLGLSREYLIKGLADSDVKAYLKYSIDVAILLGADPVEAEAQMTDVLNFQIELAKISMPREQRRNMTKLYNLYTLTELETRLPDIPLVQYLNTILKPAVPIIGTEVVGVSNITFFENLTTLIKATPPRTLANYLLWRVSGAAASYLTEEIRDIQLEFSKKLTGKTSRPPRWKECMRIVSSKLSYAVSNLYVTNFFDEGAKQQAIEMVEYIRREFNKVLDKLDWMDPITKVQAKAKADSIKSQIGYPPELKMVNKLMEYYGDLKVDDKGLLDNMIRITIFGTNYSFGKLRDPVDKSDWKRQGQVAMVNAFYSSIENSIKFPAGILQGTFFEPDRPRYMNFAAIGYVIGHEITHGFDDQGKQFDAVGNLRNWWEKETETKFLQKAQCIIKQYGAYKAPENGMLLNGINTQGENIADNGGIKQAYGAYQAWAMDNPKEKRLPGLMEYSKNQLFWISAAQVWCSKYRSEALKVRILTGVHSPGRFRVQGPFSNSHEFAADWNCPAGSPMNPTNKCSVW